MMETIDYLSNHPKSYLQCLSNRLWLRLSITGRPFSEAGKSSEPSYHVLARFDIDSLFFFNPACLVWTSYILPVVDTCPKVSFAKKKTCSEWSVFGAQHSLRNRLVLSGVIMSQVNRTLSYLNSIFYRSLKWLKITSLGKVKWLCI